MFLRCIFLDVFGVFAKNRNLRDDSAAFRHFWSHERRLMRNSGFVCAINLQVLPASLMFTFACLNDCKKCTACYLICNKFIEKKTLDEVEKKNVFLKMSLLRQVEFLMNLLKPWSVRRTNPARLLLILQEVGFLCWVYTAIYQLWVEKYQVSW